MPEAAIDKNGELRPRENYVDANGPPFVDLDVVVLAEPCP